jgi:hypothetical protein
LPCRVPHVELDWAEVLGDVSWSFYLLLR